MRELFSLTFFFSEIFREPNIVKKKFNFSFFVLIKLREIESNKQENESLFVYSSIKIKFLS